MNTHIRTILAAAALGASIAAPASAQLGGLVRKAKEAAAAKVVEGTPAGSRNVKPSDAFGPELTAASLDGVLRGLGALQTTLAKASQLRATGQEYSAQLAKSTAAHDQERQRFEATYDRARSCQDSAIEARTRESMDAYMQRMRSDPAAQAAMMKTALELSRKSAASTDTAEVRRAYLELEKSQGLDPKADTAAAVKKCGPVPVVPAWLTEQDSLRARAARVEAEVRDLEYQATSDAAGASGMQDREFALARERVVHWYRETHGGAPVQAFGAEERKLLEARKADIEKFQKLLT